MSTAASVFGCALRRLIVTLLVVVASPPASAFAQFDTWTSVGPDGGTVQALAVHPTTPDVLYAGGVNGLFKSVDGGGTWWRAEAGLGSRTIGSLAVLPSSEVFAGTAAGLYVSHDAGETWTLVNTSANGPGHRDGGGRERREALRGVQRPDLHERQRRRQLDASHARVRLGRVTRHQSGKPQRRLRVGGDQRPENGGWGKHLDDASSGLTGETMGMLAIDPLAPDTVYVPAASIGFSPLPGQVACWRRCTRPSTAAAPGRPS